MAWESFELLVYLPPILPVQFTPSIVQFTVIDLS